MISSIKIALDNDIYKLGVSQFIQWDYAKNPHMAIFGSTGSGKTYFSKLLLARIGLYIEDSEIVLCDFKADNDFSFAADSSNFFRFNDCLNGLNGVVDLLRQRQQVTTPDRHPIFFFFDEWASILNSMDKKTAESAKQNLSLLLMLGRSFGIHVILSQQRLDAANFNSTRDNFSVVIGLGSLSKEMVEMSFNSYKDVIDRNKPQGQGSIIIGNQFSNIRVPAISNQEKLHNAIMNGLNRYS